jgi:hypothetical protein
LTCAKFVSWGSRNHAARHIRKSTRLPPGGFARNVRSLRGPNRIATAGLQVEAGWLRLARNYGFEDQLEMTLVILGITIAVVMMISAPF